MTNGTMTIVDMAKELVEGGHLRAETNDCFYNLLYNESEGKLWIKFRKKGKDTHWIDSQPANWFVKVDELESFIVDSDLAWGW